MKTQEPVSVISSREGEVKVWCSSTAYLDPKGLIPHPDNNNLHSQAQVDLMKVVILSNGWREPVVLSGDSQKIVAGHLRVLAAIELGLDKVPVDTQFFASRIEEVKHLTADNEIARLAEFDKSIFLKTKKSFKKELGKNQFEMNFKNPGEFGLVKWPKEEEDEKGKNAPLAIQSLLKDGDTWLLGDTHRLILGETNSLHEDHLQKFLRKFRKLNGSPAVLQSTGQTFDEVMDERRNNG